MNDTREQKHPPKLSVSRYIDKVDQTMVHPKLGPVKFPREHVLLGWCNVQSAFIAGRQHGVRGVGDTSTTQRS
jgi:hypothetical protein